MRIGPSLGHTLPLDCAAFNTQPGIELDPPSVVVGKPDHAAKPYRATTDNILQRIMIPGIRESGVLVVEILHVMKPNLFPSGFGCKKETLPRPEIILERQTLPHAAECGGFVIVHL